MKGKDGMKGGMMKGLTKGPMTGMEGMKGGMMMKGVMNDFTKGCGKGYGMQTLDQWQQQQQQLQQQRALHLIMAGFTAMAQAHHHPINDHFADTWPWHGGN